MNYQNYTPYQNLILPAHKKIVLVGGCFDILHFGHIQFLEKSKKLGDYLIVALEPDERIIHHKNRLPIHIQKERMHNLLALHSVNHVLLLPILHGFEDYLIMVQKLKPAIIAVTNNDPQLSNKQKQATAI